MVSVVSKVVEEISAKSSLAEKLYIEKKFEIAAKIYTKIVTKHKDTQKLLNPP